MVYLVCFFFGLFLWCFDLFYFFSFFSLCILSLVLGGDSFGGVFFSDWFSFFLIFLSVLVLCYCLFSSLVDYWSCNEFSGFVFSLGLIFFCLLVGFSCFSHLFFYFSFEFIFVLMFFFLLGWGYSPERLQASFYMVFYTLIVSFPFLVYMVWFGGDLGKFHLWGVGEGYWWLVFFVVFLVKLPVYGVHLWLPKAHVEAPVSGSMVLAGVLLKLGGYGVVRFSFYIPFAVSFKNVFFSLGLVGGVISCFLCLRQSDLKAFVAYSSVCHMGFGLGGLLGGTFIGFEGGVFMLVGHGFCSSCLFYILFVFYERFYSRSLLILKGLSFFIPLLGLFWFLFCVLNMGVPPSFPFFSEVLIISGLSSFSFSSVFFSGGLLFFSGLYGIFLFTICFHSIGSLDGMGLKLSVREYFLFYEHLFYLGGFILLLGYFVF